MSFNLLRHTSVFNNVLTTTMRKRDALSFRKTLGVYNYKVKPARYYKNPHALDLKMKEQLKKSGTEKSWRKIHQLERMSHTPFGRSGNKGKFIPDWRRVPNYNIPSNLEETGLKPYVTYKTDKIPEDDLIQKHEKVTETLLHDFKETLKNSNDEELRKLAKEIFETDYGKEIVKEYLVSMEKKSKLKITNF
jgi:large subunit ribosomal protein L41